MTLAATTTAALLVVVALLGYAALSYAILFYLPPPDRLGSGAVADVAFVATLPFVLAVTWLAGAGSRG